VSDHRPISDTPDRERDIVDKPRKSNFERATLSRQVASMMTTMAGGAACLAYGKRRVQKEHFYDRRRVQM
jgi:hypothetical protein